eukprot:CAMPEP_0118923008 /NCGR_PEP_ID=MMETSP1169-20130426/1704_1 /TAXON_ID=36882 /ORGANISM="Pyramimonas obovata, Strain CCMP722" /LENGTH=596 /DNA_ID=CAMNT_0006863941 /DNA_START=331 /DNA_END=2117 /DNA_ORIENTATION=+
MLPNGGGCVSSRHATAASTYGPAPIGTAFSRTKINAKPSTARSTWTCQGYDKTTGRTLGWKPPPSRVSRDLSLNVCSVISRDGPSRMMATESSAMPEARDNGSSSSTSERSESETSSSRMASDPNDGSNGNGSNGQNRNAGKTYSNGRAASTETSKGEPVGRSRSAAQRERTKMYKHKKRRAGRVIQIQKGEGVQEKYLMKRVLDLGRRRQVTQVLRELESQDKRPGVEVHNAVVNVCCECGYMDQAFDLLYKMEGDGGPGSDAVTYSTLMKGLGRARRVDDAWMLMERWEVRVRRRLERKAGYGTYTEAYVPPSVTGHIPRELIYTLMNVCAETGDVARARAVMFRFHGAFIGNERVFNMLIKACARSLRPLRVAEILQDMQRAGLAPDKTSYNSILHACSNARRPDLARLVLATMRARAAREGDPGLAPDAWSYTAALTAEARRARADSEVASGPVSRLTEHLREAMPFGCEDAEQWAELLRVEAPPPEEQLPCVIPESDAQQAAAAEARGGKSAIERVLELAREMSEAGTPLDRTALAALVHACVDAGSVPHARHFLARMRALGHAPRPATYLLLLSAMLAADGAGAWAEEAG